MPKKEHSPLLTGMYDWIAVNAITWALVYPWASSKTLLENLSLFNVIISNMGTDYYTFWNTWVVIIAVASFWWFIIRRM